MARFPGKTMPWRADHPAIAFYNTFFQDGRLSAAVRDAAAKARDPITDSVIAHRESVGYAPFGNSDVDGRTVHFPVNLKEVDPWAAGGINETENALYTSAASIYYCARNY